MAEFFASGRAADLIAAILVAELIWLLVGRKLSIGDAASAVLPGLLLALALRAALTGAAWPWIAGPLALAGVAHMWDLRRRLSRSSRA